MNTVQTPKHIAIIMDGNRRWARERKMSTLSGHKAGGDAMKNIVKHARHLGVEVLTVYAFSSENWDRPAAEVKGLMTFFKSRLKKEVPELHKENVRVKFVGDKSRFSSALQKIMQESEELTAKNTGLTLCPAMNYGSWEEVVSVGQKVARLVERGDISPQDVDAKLMASCFYTAGLPSLDMMIRSGGECRLSNFLLLQSAYAELIFVDTLWPDFTPTHLEEAIEEFQNRSRRFGR